MPLRAPALCVAALLTFNTLGAMAAHAMWTHDPSANLAVCTAVNGQTTPFALADGAGGMFVAWSDFRTPGTAAIYLQHVDAAGATTWAPNGVPVLNVAGNSFALIGGMVSDGAGGVVLAWSDHRGTTFDVRAQRVNGTGTVLWTTNGVALCSAAGDQGACTLVSDGAGGAIVAWDDNRNGSSYDVFAQRVDVTGAILWPGTGVALCTAAFNQVAPVIDADGAGGAIVCWRDLRSNVDADLYAQRVNGSGVPLWAVDGVVVSNAPGDQTSQGLVSDGTGGAIVAWSDAHNGTFDIYAQHLTSTGASLWAANGLAVCTAAADQTSPVVVSDRLGGAYVTWIDGRTGEGDIHTQEISGAGAGLLDADNVNVYSAHAVALASTFAVNRGLGVFCDQWTSNRYHVLLGEQFGLPVTSASGDQQHPAVVTDGNGGVLIAWDDTRNGAGDIYAQRIDRYGFYGDADPVITSITDVPGDQGGMVQVAWQPSYLDVGYIGTYRVWRAVPTLALQGGAATMRRPATTDANEAATTGKLWSGPASSQGYGWELVGSVDATPGPPPGYVLAVPTAYDSIGGSNPYAAFLVQATRGFSLVQNWNSAPDSGYSVDNLAPAAPSPLTGTYAAGVTRLHWSPNTEPDLGSYRIYRGSTPGFAIGPASRIAVQPDTGYVDAAGTPLYYQVTAVDVHGNESAASAFPGATTGVGGPAEPRLALAAPSPNPAGLKTAIRYALPLAGEARLEVFDATGRRVHVLQQGPASAGEHAVSFALDDDAGRPLACGLYLVRLQTAGVSLTRRLAVVH